MIGKEEIENKLFQEVNKKLMCYPPVIRMYYDRLIKEGKTYQSASVYVKVITHFVDFLFSGKAPFDFYRKVSVFDINRFLGSLESDSTKATNWSALNSFFNFLVPSYLSCNPMSNVDRPLISKQKKSDYLSVEETKQILNNVDILANERMRNRDKCILMLGFYCGLKSADIVQANVNDVNFERSVIRVYLKESVLDVPLSYSVRECLCLWLDDRKAHFDTTTDALFVSQIKKRISDDTLNILLKRYAVGIDKKVTTRVMRNTCVVNLYRETKNLALCAKLLGQPSISAAQRYIEQIVSDSDVEEAVNTIEDLLNDKISSEKKTANILPLAMKIIQNASIEELELSLRVRQSLRKARMKTIGDLCGWHEEELKELLCLSQSHIDEIKGKLAETGCNLSKEKTTYPSKNDLWFQNIKWSRACQDCQRDANGFCKQRSCAEENYDPWGDPLPAYLWYPDGNDVALYLFKKSKEKNSKK